MNANQLIRVLQMQIRQNDRIVARVMLRELVAFFRRTEHQAPPNIAAINLELAARLEPLADDIAAGVDRKILNCVITAYIMAASGKLVALTAGKRGEVLPMMTIYMDEAEA